MDINLRYQILWDHAKDTLFYQDIDEFGRLINYYCTNYNSPTINLVYNSSKHNNITELANHYDSDYSMESKNINESSKELTEFLNSFKIIE